LLPCWHDQADPNLQWSTMQLLELPNEILSRIISFFDTPSPSDASLLQKPSVCWDSHDGDSPAGQCPSHTHITPLKQLSLTSGLVRALTLPILFKHCVLQPQCLDGFLSCLWKHDLVQRVSSLVVQVPGPYSHHHPAWWARLLNQVPATRLTIVAPPEVFTELAGLCSWSTDAWAFDMAVQVLRFDQSAEAARTEIDEDNLPNFLVARPWQDMVINEGSSLMAYTTYEFFLRRTPSLLTALHFHDSTPGDRLFAQLLSFDFIAIFPFYNHVDEVLKCIRKMTRLERLFVKLCPEPDSTVLRDGIELAGGHMDVNDPWNECETSWMLIAHTVVFLTLLGALRVVHMDDVKIEGVRQTLEKSLVAPLQEWWTYEGEGRGTWRRNDCRAITARPSAPP